MIPTIVGGILAISGGFAAETFSNWQKIRNLRSAHAGELRAYLSLLERRQYIKVLQGHVAYMKENPGSVSIFAVRIAPGSNNNQIFSETAAQIGILPAPLPEEIVGLHYLIQSIFSDFALLVEAEADKSGKNWVCDPEECLRVHEDLIVLIETARRDAADLINLLEAKP
ncbi:MAG: hypothetical protein M3Y27_10010 [Acidobacteriota bacterium]|nr:hypothetical protein [Acidobacteriota bacterium]